MTTHELTQFGACLFAAYLMVEGFLSWLADVAIWALRLLDPSDREDDDNEDDD